MSILVDLLAALPAGAAEAVVSQGLDSFIARVKDSDEAPAGLASELEAIARDERPDRPIAEISAEIVEMLNPTIAEEINQGVEISQHGGSASSQIAVGDVGGDLYIAPPRHPHRR